MVDRSDGAQGLTQVSIITCVFLVIPIPKMRILICRLPPQAFCDYTEGLNSKDIKLIVYLASAISMLAWCLTLAGGAGPVVRQPSSVHGSEKAWLMVRFLFLAMGNCATFAR